jgi:hypothetical protein
MVNNGKYSEYAGAVVKIENPYIVPAGKEDK